MQVSSLNRSDVSFKAALSSQAVDVLSKLCIEAEKSIGTPNSYTLFDMPSSSIYSDSKEDTGSGKLCSDAALRMYSMLKPYVGFNAVKVYPSGQMTKHYDNFYCPYNRGALTLGEDNINLAKLCGSEYGSILQEKDVKEMVDSNKAAKKLLNSINYENELGTDENYPILKPLKKAYDNFKKGDSAQIKALQKEFEDFKKESMSQVYDRLALYPFLRDSDPDFFENFLKNPQKQKRFETLKKEHAEDIDFFKFNQFIAQKQHFEAKEKLNEKGIDLIGDCPIGFSQAEEWALPGAFLKEYSVGWAFPLVNYKDIDDPSSDAYKLLKSQFSHFFKLYDGVRMDVGISYYSHEIFEKGAEGKNGFSHENSIGEYNLGDNMFKFIEQTAKEVKGKDFDTKKIIYEADGEPAIYDWSGQKVKERDEIKGRALMLTTTFERVSSKNDQGWGSVHFHRDTAGVSQDELVMGTNNHDGAPIRWIAESKKGTPQYDYNKKDSIKVLSQDLKIPEKSLQNPQNFMKAKFAELLGAKKRFFYFVDVLGRREYINDHSRPEQERFRFRVDSEVEKDYHKGLQSNWAFDRPEALAMRMKAQGVDKTNPKLFEQMKFLGNYLRKPGVLTQKAADAKVAKTGHDEVLAELLKIDKKYSKQ